MTRVGLCLGAGGLTGQAFHAGVLAALQLDLEWDARDASVVVGTSAGAVTAAMLRLGISPYDLASWVLGRQWSPDQPLLAGIAAVRDELPPLSVRSYARPWRIPAVGTWLPTAEGRWKPRPLAVLSTMVPIGSTAMTELFGRHLQDSDEWAWPDGLWVCAVRRKDGRRTVFGQNPDEAPPLAVAVAASASIPGYFTPVSIDGQEYLDGGIHSPTSADLLAGRRLDLVIVVSPMSGGAGKVDRAVRRFARRRLRREVAMLRQGGTEVIVFEPGVTSARAMGLNPMAVGAPERVLQAAFFEAGELIARPEVRQLLVSQRVQN